MTEQIESPDLLVSAMVMLELEMLQQKGAIQNAAAQILSDLNQQIGLLYPNAIWQIYCPGHFHCAGVVGLKGGRCLRRVPLASTSASRAEAKAKISARVMV
jgi:hypothetical protein